MSQSKRVAFWNRMSHINSVEREAHINHRARAEEFCRFHGYELVKEYTLLDVPGSKIRTTKEYYELRADVRNKAIDALLVTGIKRFARKVKILVEEIQFLQENKVDFISMGESIDTTSPYGKFFFHLISALAELESDEVSQRIKLSVKPRAERGLPLGGSAPIGYRWADKKLVLDPKGIPVVKAAFKTFLTLMQLRPTCRALTDMGLLARKGPFTNTTLRRLLTTTAYIGRHLRNYRGVTKDGQIFIKPAEEHIFNTCPRLIDDSTWSKTQQVLSGIKLNQPSKINKHTYLLSGLLKCQCGGKLYGATYRDERWAKYVCKECYARVKMQTVDNAMVDFIGDFILRADFIEDRIRALGVPAGAHIQKARTMREILQKSSTADRAIVMKSLISSIELSGTKANVYLRFLPNVDFSQTVDRTLKVGDQSYQLPPTVQIFPGNPGDTASFCFQIDLTPRSLPEGTLPQRIKAARARRGLLQGEIDRRAGLALGSCGRFETGRNFPSKGSITKLAQALQVDRAWLLWGRAGSLAEKVRNRRMQIGLSQVEVSRRMGASHHFCNDIERGTVEVPSPKNLERLADVLGVDLAYFLGIQ